MAAEHADLVQSSLNKQMKTKKNKIKLGQANGGCVLVRFEKLNTPPLRLNSNYDNENDFTWRIHSAESASRAASDILSVPNQCWEQLVRAGPFLARCVPLTNKQIA